MDQAQVAIPRGVADEYKLATLQQINNRIASAVANLASKSGTNYQVDASGDLTLRNDTTGTAHRIAVTGTAGLEEINIGAGV